MRWYLQVLMKYNELRGRASRKELWQFVFYNMIFILLAIVIDNFAGTTAAGLPYGLFNYIYIMAIIIPGLAVAVRRLHDVGKSGWFSLILLLPFVGLVWLFVLFCADGADGDNKYGSKPQELAIN